MFQILKRKIEYSQFAESLRRFFDGVYYPIVVAVIIFLSYVFGLELIGETLILLTLALGLTVCRDLKVLFMPLLAFLFIVPFHHVVMENGVASFGFYYKDKVPYIFALGIFILLVFVLRFCIWGGFKEIFTKKNGLGWWFYPLIGGLLLNGVANPDYTPKNLLMALLCIVCWLFVYVLFYHNIKKDRETVDYFFKTCMVITGLLVCELIYVYFARDVVVDGVINKSGIFMGWGIQNNLGGILTVLFPAGVYFCYKETNLKRGVLFYLYCVVTGIAVILTLCRSAILVTGVIAVLSLICLFTKSPLKKLYAWLTVGLVAIVLVLFVVFFDWAMGFLETIINIKMGSSGRFYLWLQAIDDFIAHPLFGSGFYACDFQSYTGFLPGFYHNTLIEITAATGFVGLLGYCIYRVKTFEIIFRKRNYCNLFLGAMIIGLLFGGMFDNHLFNIYPSFYSAIALVLCDNDVEWLSAAQLNTDKN